MHHAGGTEQQPCGDRAARVSALSLCVFVLFATVFLAVASPAFADNEGGSTDPARTDCAQCHTEDFQPDKGPHGLYNDPQYAKCAVCHDVHQNPGALQLLPRNTLVDSCNVCHDGTGGQGVYGALASRGVSAAASHSIDATDVIPGGNAATGGSATGAFGGQNAYLSCDDCHNPHDADTVNPFRGERFRGGNAIAYLGFWTYPDVGSTTKLLRRRPSGATTSVAEYGSDWCAACHAGRKSGGVVHNHPVDSKATTTTPFDYNHVALVASDNLTMTTVIAPMSQLYGAASDPTNRGYLMPWPRTSQQGAHLPICQQCHEDSRNAGTLSSSGADPATLSVTATGFANQYPATDNPRFQNFPHETANARMLVETADDLCTNCHLAAQLP